MLKQILILLSIFSIGNHMFATTIYDTLYINKAPFQIGGSFGFTFQACVFNDSSNFNAQNSIIEINENDNLQLHVINNDTLSHTFTLEGIVDNNNIIGAGTSKDFAINFTSKGAYRFYSDVFYGKHLGASSIIMYGYENYPRYYWNLFDQSDTLSYEIADLTATHIPLDYTPDIFSINMKVHPDLENDPYAKILQNIGDTIFITILNSGAMLHTMHFHGYHVDIIDASINSLYNGWTKDSFSILKEEIVLVRLIPEQSGVYPVHDHNLINITTNGIYPGGMLNLIDIQP